jgi:hypothetical protein
MAWNKETLYDHCFSALLRVHENPEGLKSNGTHQLLACADDVNMVGENIDTVQKNTIALLDASKEFGLEVNSEKTKCVLNVTL